MGYDDALGLPLDLEALLGMDLQVVVEGEVWDKGREAVEGQQCACVVPGIFSVYLYRHPTSTSRS